MQQQSRFQEAVHTLWECGHQQYRGWPAEQREAGAPAASAPLAWPGECTSVAELDLRYRERGDPPGVLRRQRRLEQRPGG